jgi:dephospho-CoA kinase
MKNKECSTLNEENHADSVNHSQNKLSAGHRPHFSTSLLVALTGGIGCGKTTVLNEFRKLGIPCFVADEVAGAYYSDPAFLTQIRDLFGDRVFRPDDTVDKKAIAAIVFANSAMLQRLNALVHPRVWDDFVRFASQHTDAPYILFESAIVYEYGFDRLVDKVICVYLEKEERLRRLELRDHATRAQLEARMANQLSAEEKMHRADYVILNYEGNPRTRQVQHIHNLLLAGHRQPEA